MSVSALTVKQIAERLAMKSSQVYSLRKSKTNPLPLYPTSPTGEGGWRIDPDDLEAWIQRQKEAAAWA